MEHRQVHWVTTKTPDGVSDRETAISVIAQRLRIKPEDINNHTPLGDEHSGIARDIIWKTGKAIASRLGMTAGDLFQQLEPHRPTTAAEATHIGDVPITPTPKDSTSRNIAIAVIADKLGIAPNDVKDEMPLGEAFGAVAMTLAIKTRRQIITSREMTVGGVFKQLGV